MEEDKIAVCKNKKTCFIITPIGDDSDPIRRHIDGLIDECIIPVLSDKFEINVAHRMSSPGSITNQVIAEIYNSDLVIANLTNLNANVMYELAFRHAVKKPVVIIMQKGTGTLPFDTISERTIFYTNDFKGAIELKERLLKAVEMIDSLVETDIDNPIYNALERIMIKENVIKNISNKGEDEANILNYILDSLQRLENRSLFQAFPNKEEDFGKVIKIRYDHDRNKFVPDLKDVADIMAVKHKIREKDITVRVDSEINVDDDIIDCKPE